jgi:hypothetical protein
METPFISARVQAEAILQAWGSENLALLRCNLISAEQMPPPVADTGESERLEILAAIAGDMRELIERDQLGGASKYLPLLQHLASPPPRSYEYAYCC